jgi:mannose-6-phosphate isomerase-like protein (cupin superfamily)
MTLDSGVTIRSPGEGRVIGRPGTGGAAIIKLTAAESRGVLSVFESSRPKGDTGGPKPHSHAFDEVFYVLEGTYEFILATRVVRATVGAMVYVPGGELHGFRSTGDADGRMLTICTPGGIENIFEELSRTAPEAKA